MSMPKIVLAASLLAATSAYAQSTSGTLVVVPAFAEVVHANDQAIASFSIEEQDKDKAVAASRVNQKMKQGMEIIRREDPQAALKTQGYYTYPVYAEQRPLPNGTVVKPQITGWRVGQNLEVKTLNLAGLPKTTAAAQKVLALAGLNFGLAPATLRKLDDERIAATYKNLGERIASIAAAMGRNRADATLDTVDFEGSGNYAGQDRAQAAPMAMKSLRMSESASVAEPSFEPGETTLQMNLVGKVRFK
jgi:predicted secreted protein